MKLLAGETQYEYSQLVLVSAVCLHACMSLAALQTSAAKVKFQSGWNQSIEPVVEHPCLQLSAASGHSDALLRSAESQYSPNSAALMHSLHSQVSTPGFSLTNVQMQYTSFFFLQSKRTPMHMIYALECANTRTHAHTNCDT